MAGSPRYLCGYLEMLKLCEGLSVVPKKHGSRRSTLFLTSTTKCMTRSSTKELFTPFKKPKQEFRSSRKLLKTLSIDKSRSPEFNPFSDLEEYFEEEVAKTMAETMEQYMRKTRADYGSGIARPKINNKYSFELKGQFLKELCDNTFSGSDRKDANEHIEKVLEIVDTKRCVLLFNAPFMFPIRNMALSPRDQRHQYLRFEGLQYTDADIADFETRLGKIYSRDVHRASHEMEAIHFGFGITIVEEMQTAGFGLHWTASARIQCRGYATGSSPIALLGGVRHLKRVIVRDLPIIDMAKITRLHICEELVDTWAWVAPRPERQPDAVVGAPKIAKGALDVEKGDQAILAPVQGPRHHQLTVHTITDHNDVEWFRRGEAFQAKKCDIRKPIWYMDSECSRHMTGVKSYMHKYVEHLGPKVVFGDDSTCITEGYGSIKYNGIVFTNVAFINGRKYNLLSISQLCDAKYIIQFDEKGGTIFNSNKEVVMIVLRVRDVYVLDMTSSAQESCFFAKASENLN
ncbi:hypothetical protein Tco_0751736 [Tanacetum coccineum]|uniref:Retrovirus-related Pol polyprotein from transposon TNT 1-94-like beta-barrel domain-containing protein n=1 Tax=Tanacetum coccineum TaxID=301880 RepID=A0ABQ4Z805_9ASTR